MILYFAIPDDEDERLAGSSERRAIDIGDLVLGGCHVHALCRLGVQKTLKLNRTDIWDMSIKTLHINAIIFGGLFWGFV